MPESIRNGEIKLVNDTELLQMQTDLVNKKCQVYILSSETTTNLVSEVIEISKTELYHPALKITLKNETGSHTGPVLTIYKPFTFTKKLNMDGLMYEFRRDSSPFLLMGYRTEEDELLL